MHVSCNGMYYLCITRYCTLYIKHESCEGEAIWACVQFFFIFLSQFFFKNQGFVFQRNLYVCGVSREKIHKNIFSFNVSTQCLPEITVTQSQTAIVTLNFSDMTPVGFHLCGVTLQLMTLS